MPEDLNYSLEIGKLQEQVAAVRRDNDRMAESLERIEVDVRAMAATMNQARGGWRLILAVAGASSALGAVVTWLVKWSER